MLELDRIYNMDCIEGMKLLPDMCIDLIVTSPPYDDLRDYTGYSFDFENIVKELYRVIKEGGVVVWVVGDRVKDGSETLIPFKQALFFKDVGFNIHDTMIYQKLNGLLLGSTKAYMQKFEYMFVLVKGKIKTVNLIRDRKINYNEMDGWNTTRKVDGTKKKLPKKELPSESIRSNIWGYLTGIPHSTKDNIAYNHPAIFPEKLAEDHIISWSNERDVVLDPLCGSGTTCKMAKLLNRRFIGIDSSQEYCKIAEERINSVKTIQKPLLEG